MASAPLGKEQGMSTTRPLDDGWLVRWCASPLTLPGRNRLIDGILDQLLEVLTSSGATLPQHRLLHVIFDLLLEQILAS